MYLKVWPPRHIWCHHHSRSKSNRNLPAYRTQVGRLVTIRILTTTPGATLKEQVDNLQIKPRCYKLSSIWLDWYPKCLNSSEKLSLSSLAALFDWYCGLGQIQLKIASPKEIRYLFRQVGVLSLRFYHSDKYQRSQRTNQLFKWYR